MDKSYDDELNRLLPLQILKKKLPLVNISLPPLSPSPVEIKWPVGTFAYYRYLHEYHCMTLCIVAFHKGPYIS